MNTFDWRSGVLDFSTLSNALAGIGDRYRKSQEDEQSANALSGAYADLRRPQRSNALTGPTAPIPTPDAMSQPMTAPISPVSYGVQGGARNAMFDMGSLGASTAANALAAPRDDYLSQIKRMETDDPTKPASWDYKQQTNGYGTRAKFPGERLDPQEADARFGNEINKARQIVESHAPNAPEGWKQALTSLTFNAGADWTKSGLGAAVAAGDYETAKGRFAQYVKAGGQTLPGLQSRRAQELGWTNGAAQPVAQQAPLQPQQPVRTADSTGGLSQAAYNALARSSGTRGLAEGVFKDQYARSNPTREEDLSYQGKLTAQQQQQMEIFGKQAMAVDGLEGPQRAAAWNRIIQLHNQQHPGEHLTPEETDPKTGPKLMAVQAGLAAERSHAFTTIGHDDMGNPKYGFVDPKSMQVTPYQAGGQQAADAGAARELPQGEDYLKSLNPQIATQVKAIAEGRMPLPSGFALKSPYWQTMIRHVSQYDPGFDAVNYNARAATRKDFTSGKSAQNITSFNTAIGHIESLDKAIDGLDNSDYTAVNMANNAYANQVGGDRQNKLQDFETARNAVKEELTRAFKGTGGSLTEVEGWDKLIDASKSKAGLKAAARAAVNLLESRLDAVGEQYNKGMGTTLEPIKLLTPKAQAAWTRLNSKAAPPDSGDGAGRFANPNLAPSAPNARAQPRRAPDGNLYIEDPNRPGKYLMMVP